MSSYEPNEKSRVLIVDDHPLIRQGIAAALADTDDLTVCGQAGDAETAVDLALETEPDAAIVDLGLDHSSGLDLIHALRLRCPEVRVLVLSMKDEGFYAERVIRAGARGFLSKDQGPDAVVDALRRILEGGIYVSEAMATRIISRVAGGSKQTEDARIDSLTDREITVLELIGAGLPAREIARRLHISSKTVDSHREHIKTKLKLKDAAALMRFAVEWGQDQGLRSDEA